MCRRVLGFEHSKALGLIKTRYFLFIQFELRQRKIKKSRVKYKRWCPPPAIATCATRCRSGGGSLGAGRGLAGAGGEVGPSYLCNLIELYKPTRNLRSADRFLLKEIGTDFKTLGEKSFAFSSPKVWNSLPITLRMEKSFDIFKKNLKTFYFRKAYNV